MEIKGKEYLALIDADFTSELILSLPLSFSLRWPNLEMPLALGEFNTFLELMVL